MASEAILNLSRKYNRYVKYDTRPINPCKWKTNQDNKLDCTEKKSFISTKLTTTTVKIQSGTQARMVSPWDELEEYVSASRRDIIELGWIRSRESRPRSLQWKLSDLRRPLWLTWRSPCQVMRADVCQNSGRIAKWDGRDMARHVQEMLRQWMNNACVDLGFENVECRDVWPAAAARLPCPSVYSLNPWLRGWLGAD